ncbi:MAG: hypothetical protein GX084_07305, partial [Acholeplasmataceae bacterium]|nr:hypothetical protein [Acholeplasmataceae bacterium]
MYSRNIDVVIASRSESLSQLLAGVPMSEEFNVSLTRTDTTTENNPLYCDILICDFDGNELRSIEDVS